uniref:Uncharacterized protein n=1 Tax=Oryza brachyantha TaxID=4533 RepID=J3MIT6_ORYBR
MVAQLFSILTMFCDPYIFLAKKKTGGIFISADTGPGKLYYAKVNKKFKIKEFSNTKVLIDLIEYVEPTEPNDVVLHSEIRTVGYARFDHQVTERNSFQEKLNMERERQQKD